MTVNQCFAMNFRHGTGIMHMNPRHGPLSDKSDPTAQFAGYGPALMVYHDNLDPFHYFNVLTSLC